MFNVDTAFFERFGFFSKQYRVENHPISDDVDLAVLEYSRWNRAEHIFLAFKFKSMSGVWASLEPCHYVVARSQHVNHFAFTFIAPLQSEKNINFHNNYSIIGFSYCFFDCFSRRKQLLQMP